MTDSSATGYLQPQGSPYPVPLDDEALQAFLESWVAGITGVDPDFVRPRWEPTPAGQPPLGTNWIALGVTDEDGGWNAAVRHVQTTTPGVSADVVQRHPDFDVLFSFYGPLARNNASLLREGIAVRQNREPLARNGIGWKKTGEIVNASRDINGQYYHRLDMIMAMCRNITRVYPVDNLVSSSGTVETDTKISANWATANVKGK